MEATHSRKRYPTDLTDEQWAIVEPLLPQPKNPGRGRGRPLKYSKRDILDAMFYVTKGACTWRMLPHEFPSWRIVYWYFGVWRDDGTLERINAELVKQVRIKKGRNPRPSAVILDSQAVKSTAKGGSLDR
jgi:putative transposase